VGAKGSSMRRRRFPVLLFALVVLALGGIYANIMGWRGPSLVACLQSWLGWSKDAAEKVRTVHRVLAERKTTIADLERRSGVTVEQAISRLTNLESPPASPPLSSSREIESADPALRSLAKDLEPEMRVALRKLRDKGLAVDIRSTR